MSNLIKIRRVGVESFYGNRRTEKHTGMIIFANASENGTPNKQTKNSKYSSSKTKTIQ
jgi:hypothetical protein